VILAAEATLDIVRNVAGQINQGVRRAIGEEKAGGPAKTRDS
jgi:hypothetical protein